VLVEIRRIEAIACTIGTVAVASGLLALGQGPPAHAASVVTVTSAVDAATGGCETTGTGTPCTLRQAIKFANNHPRTTIMLDAVTYKLNPGGLNENDAEAGDLDVTASTTILGAGSAKTHITAFDPNHTQDRLFGVFQKPGANDPVELKVAGVDFASGFAHDTFGGGAIWIGPNAHADGTDVRFVDNATSDGVGGAIAVAGTGATLTLRRAAFETNRASAGDGTGAAALGGAIHVGIGTAQIVDSTFTGNSATGGTAPPDPLKGGLGKGGAIAVDATGALRVERSLFTANAAVGGAFSANGKSGGGAEGGALFADGVVTLLNSSFVGNTARGGNATGTGTPGSSVGGAAIVSEVHGTNLTIVANNSEGGSSPALPGG
jgi:CSLREA domain-containing protein